MRWLVLVVAACGTSPKGPTTSVFAFAGNVADTAATVIAHRADGTVIDSIPTDAVGRADVLVEANALVTVVFGTQGIATVVTTVEGPAGGQFEVHGPPRPKPPVTVGAIVISPVMPLDVNAGFDIELGCATAHVATFPATIDVDASCLGSDSNIDVLVRGYNSTGSDLPVRTLAGYTAARVSMIEGAATFAPARWETTGPQVPATIDAGPRVYLDWTLLSDGLPFASAPINASGQLWTGLVVDGARVDASLAGETNTAQVTTISLAGTPTQIHVGVGDFLPAITSSLALDDRAHLAMHWTPATIGDAIDLHLEWQTKVSRLNWDVILPPDRGSIRLLIDAATEPVVGMSIHALLRYIDSTDVDGFAALLAAGLHVDQTIRASTVAALPAAGELRVAHEIATF